MSHELRTPLTLILGPLEMLLSQEKTLSPAVRAELERMRRNATRLHLLVNDILDASKIEAGRAAVVWEPVDVVKLTRDIVVDATAATRARGIALSLVERGTLLRVTIDRAKLERIVLNLIANALKFTPAGGRIDVELTALPHNGFELAVADTGIGIPLEEQGRLFERFHQIDSSARRQYEGTGLGLSLVKEFAELMGGAVGVESEVGKGSRFYVRFDRLERTLDEPTTSAPSFARRSLDEALLSVDRSTEEDGSLRLAAKDTARARVLVVEDNPDMRSFVVEILSKEYAIDIAEDGGVGLALARSVPFDVIVSDIMMPRMDGLELVACLKQDPALRNVPVILLTAKTTGDDLVAGLAQGADDYLRKPFSPSELKARIGAALRLRRTIRELEVALEALQRTQGELIQSEKMAAVGTLIAGLSHELNNPLAVISMNTELLLANRDCEAIADRALPTIRTQTERCAQLVKALLDFSRRKQTDREVLLLHHLLEPIRALAAPMAEQRGIDLGLEGSVLADSVDQVYVCRQEMETAILNLVTNAIAATPRGGKVSIQTKRATQASREGVLVSVVDTGQGIPDDVKNRIFDPFFTTKAPGQGTGIGLSLARRIVEAHGGAIRIESQLGQGTVAVVWLPLSTMEKVS